MKCSFFRNKKDSASRNYVKVDSILSGIKNGKWKDAIIPIREEKIRKKRDELKSNIPGASFSGTFELKRVMNKKGKYIMRSRDDNHIIDYTQLVTIDIDDKNVNTIRALRNKLAYDPYVYSYFLSPSGGLKILYRVNSSAEHHRDHAFEQVKGWVEDNYNVEVDSSGKNISRLCYVSFDPDLYFNKECEVFEVDTTKVKTMIVCYRDTGSKDYSSSIKEIYTIAKGWLDTEGYGVGNRNNFIHKMACILNRAGLSEDQIAMAIMNNHSISQEIYPELLTTVKGVCSRNAHEFGTKKIWKQGSGAQQTLFDINDKTE